MEVIADIFYTYSVCCRELRGHAEQRYEEFVPYHLFNLMPVRGTV